MSLGKPSGPLVVSSIGWLVLPPYLRSCGGCFFNMLAMTFFSSCLGWYTSFWINP